MKYSDEIREAIGDMIAAGENKIPDICKAAGITPSTFFLWKKEKSEFSEYLKSKEAERREVLRLKASSGLSKLLDVHEVEEVTTEWVSRRKMVEGKEQEVPTIKSQKKTKRIFMPSAAAIIYTLNNTDSTNWKQRNHIEHSGLPGAGLDLSLLSDEQLDSYLELTRQATPPAAAVGDGAA